MTDHAFPVSEPQPGFIVKDGKVLKARLIGVEHRSIVVLYEEDNQLHVSDVPNFYTQRFAAEFAAAEQ